MKQLNFLLIFLCFCACQSGTPDTEKYPESTKHELGHDHNHEGHDHSGHNHDGHDHSGHSHGPQHASVSEALAHIPMPNVEYAPDFLNSMMTMGGQMDVLIDGDKIIIDKTDTLTFPADPPKDEVIKVSGKNKNFRIEGAIKRYNYTSIQYAFNIEDAAHKSCTYAGFADMSPGFILGVESDEDPSTGISYTATEYIAENQACQSLSIRIGKAEDKAEEPYLVKLISDCESVCAALDLDNGPTLKQE